MKSLPINTPLPEARSLRAIVTGFGVEAQTRDRLACMVALSICLLKHNLAGLSSHGLRTRMQDH